MYKRSTNQKTGESMEKPCSKLKKIILITGITGAVYVCFKYLLPLIIPFLAAYGIALLLKPSVSYIERKSRIEIKGRKFHIPVSIIGTAELLTVLILLGMFCYFTIYRLCLELQLLVEQFPYFLEKFDVWLSDMCRITEQLFHLKSGCMSELLREMIFDVLIEVRSAAMMFLLGNSVTFFKIIIAVIVVIIIIFIASILSLQEMERLKKKIHASIFAKEIETIGAQLASIGNAYIKTQIIIIFLTMIISSAGLFMLGNPYYILLGIFIGFVDALPVLGTGTVLIPWAVVYLINGKWIYAVILFAIYITCYVLRQVLEAKLIGNRAGLSPLETLASIYIGFRLFGLFGFILGPVAIILIQSLAEAGLKRAADT